MRVLFLSFIVMSAAPVYGLEIAFLSKVDSQGNREVFEPGGRFVHVAVRYKGKWLQARPYYGVSLDSDFGDMGAIEEILVDPAGAEVSDDFVRAVLGKKYFVASVWTDPDTFNCSKLIGELVHAAPQPMYFDESIWGTQFDAYNGRPGLTPDELYAQLVKEKHYAVRSVPCRYRL